jgi:hypothetical protein
MRKVLLVTVSALMSLRAAASLVAHPQLHSDSAIEDCHSRRATTRRLEGGPDGSGPVLTGL